MSWKSLVTAGLLCVLASPAFAAPSLTISNGGLDSSGNWIWNVSVTTSAAGTPVAAELGLRETTTGSQVVSAAKNATNFDTDNPGTVIFGWETLTDVDPGAGTNNRPVGLQTNLPTDEIFAALGSIDFASVGPHEILTVKTAGPSTTTSLSTSMEVLGKYGTGSVNGRLAEITGSSALNYSNFAGSVTRTTVAGDANLSNGVAGTTAAVTLSDLTILATNLNKPGSFTWAQGDFNGTTGGASEVSLADLTALATNLNKTNVVGTANNSITINGVAGGSGASVGAVPEPASIAMAGLALLGCLGMFGRKR